MLSYILIYYIVCLSLAALVKKNLNKLFLKQKLCIRFISKSSYNAHTEPLFHETGILPFYDLISQQKMLIMHSIYHSYSAVNYSPFLQKNNELATSSYDLRNSDDFFIPKMRLEKFKRYPIYDFCNQWNNLDCPYKYLPNKRTFKLGLKYDLLSKYSNFRCSRLFCFSCMSNI